MTFDPNWAPREDVDRRWPGISVYDESYGLLTCTRGHHEATVALYGRTDLSPRDLQLQTLEAAYDGVIKPTDNIALTFSAMFTNRLLSIEYPFFEEPVHDKEVLDLLNQIKSKVPAMKDFYQTYFMLTTFVTGKNCHPIAQLYVGNLNHREDLKPRMKQRYPVGDVVATRGGGNFEFYGKNTTTK